MNSDQSKYRRELSLLIATEMKSMLFDAVQKECDGCVHEQPNQMAHDVCLAPLNERIERCFLHMMNAIDFEKLDVKCSKELLIQDKEWATLTKNNLLAQYDDED